MEEKVSQLNALYRNVRTHSKVLQTVISGDLHCTNTYCQTGNNTQEYQELLGEYCYTE